MQLLTRVHFQFDPEVNTVCVHVCVLCVHVCVLCVCVCVCVRVCVYAREGDRINDCKIYVNAQFASKT